MKKISKSEVMKRAWAMYRSEGKSFSECLRQAWKIVKMLSIGNLWEKHGYSRIYFQQDDLLEMNNVKLRYYKSGSVASCQVNGQDVSNAEGCRWLNSTCKVFFDLITGRFNAQGRHAEEVIGGLRLALNI